MPELPAPKQFQFIAGNLALDFCNTMGGKRSGIPHELLKDFADYVQWSFQAGLIDDRELGESLRVVQKAPAKGEQQYQRALALREALHNICAKIIDGEKVRAADLELLNAELARNLGRLQLVSSAAGKNFKWGWAEQGDLLQKPLGPIAFAGANLLLDEHALAELRSCNGDNCGWLFLDCSRNHSRRWCDMRDCGNRAKIRRHRQRHKH